VFVLLLAAHQGEEFVMALPVVLLGAAFILLKWAAGNEHPPDEEPLATGEVAVEPPDEHQPATDPGDGERQVQLAGQGLAERHDQQGER
jgi:hypothetical protein